MKKISNMKINRENLILHGFKFSKRSNSEIGEVLWERELKYTCLAYCGRKNISLFIQVAENLSSGDYYVSHRETEEPGIQIGHLEETGQFIDNLLDIQCYYDGLSEEYKDLDGFSV